MTMPGLNIRFAALALASLIGMSVCFAGPAPSESPPPRLMMLPARPRLDLRVPDIAKPADGYRSAPGMNAPAFRLPIAKPKSPAEALVTRARREGLPVARLWENDHALVSLGFNQKGQAGLWLIQKFP